MRQVVITATGVLSSLGNSVEEFRAELLAGRSGIGEVLDAPVSYLAKVKSVAPCGRSVYLDAVENLMTQISADLPPGLEVDALISGHRDPSEMHVAREALARGHFASSHLRELVREGPLEAAAAYLRREKSITVREDRQIWISNACNTGNCALGIGLNKIRGGDWQRALILNLELDPNIMHILGFFLLGALNTERGSPQTASRPFAQHRAGFVKAEGAVVFMLEERSLAEARGAKILAVVRGFGSANDAYHLTESRPDSAGCTRAMRNALADAHLTIDEIDCLSAHATSTVRGDPLEFAAIERVFGGRRKKLKVTALKAQLGHATFASGGLEALAAVLALQEQRLSPAINLPEDDPKSIVSFAREDVGPIDNILCNNIGFGGQSSSLILQRTSI